MSTLYTNARVLGPDGAPSGANAFAVEGDSFAWVGTAPDGERSVDLGGAIVTPGFVDAHVHLTGTGISLGGLDLHGVRNRGDLARSLLEYVRRVPDRFVVGHGWDDTTWRTAPSREQVDGVAGERLVYLARVDGHSSLVSSRLLKDSKCERAEGVDRDASGSPTGVVRREANQAVREYLFKKIPDSVVRAAHRRAADHAVSLGITTVHEMGGPFAGAGERDLGLLMRARLPVRVLVYFATADLSVVRSRDLPRVGGDFNVDGALGSRTAALLAPYADAAGQRGFLYRDAGDLAEFFESATRASLQAGVHCIGDAACEAAVRGLEQAAAKAGTARVRALRHRLEHFEMSNPSLLARAARLGAGISMQPAFDAFWGGDRGMYATRVGATRSKTMNNFRAALRSGAVLGFGSDSPVTPMDPLGAIAAASSPHVSSHAIGLRQAWTAAVTGGHALAREDDRRGRIEAGMGADVVVWDGDPVDDPRAARVAATIVGGRRVYGDLPARRLTSTRAGSRSAIRPRKPATRRAASRAE